MFWLVERQLRSKNPSKRQKAVERLCTTPSPKTARAFQRALAHSNPDVRRTAVEGFCRIADGAGVQPLLPMLDDQHPEVVKTAILALRKYADKTVQSAIALLLRNKNGGLRATAAQVLLSQNWQPESAEDLAWLLVARGNFARAAGECGPTAVPALEAVITGGPYDLSVRAVESLGTIPSPDVPPILLRALSSADPGVCTAAIDALGSCGGPEIVQPVMRMLSHNNVHVRAIAAEVLGRLRATGAVKTLTKMTRDPRWDVRRAAVEALGRIRDCKGLEALALSLSDPDQDVRETAARALGNIRDRRAIGPLVLTLCDKDTSVRRITAASLSRILEDWGASPEAFAMVGKIKDFLHDGDQEVRRRATDLLASLIAAQQSRSTDTGANPKAAVALFLDSIRDADPDLRLAAAEALSRLADPEAIPALELAGKDPDPNVRGAAERGLVLLGLNSPADVCAT